MRKQESFRGVALRMLFNLRRYTYTRAYSASKTPKKSLRTHSIQKYARVVSWSLEIFLTQNRCKILVKRKKGGLNPLKMWKQTSTCGLAKRNSLLTTFQNHTFLRRLMALCYYYQNLSVLLLAIRTTNIDLWSIEPFSTISRSSENFLCSTLLRNNSQAISCLMPKKVLSWEFFFRLKNFEDTVNVTLRTGSANVGKLHICHFLCKLKDSSCCLNIKLDKFRKFQWFSYN